MVMVLWVFLGFIVLVVVVFVGGVVSLLLVVLDNGSSCILYFRIEMILLFSNNIGNGYLEYIVYVFVFVFFVMGFFGVFICYLFKKKGYCCMIEVE